MHSVTAIQAIFSRPPASLVFDAPDTYDDEGDAVPRLTGKRPGMALELLGAPRLRMASLGLAVVATPQAGRDLALGALLLRVCYSARWLAGAVWYGAQLGRIGAAPATAFTEWMPDRKVRVVYDPTKRYAVIQVNCDDR